VDGIPLPVLEKHGPTTGDVILMASAAATILRRRHISVSHRDSN